LEFSTRLARVGKRFQSLALRAFNQYACKIIHRDQKEQNQKILRNKCRIENATGAEKERPAQAVGQKKIERGNDRKEKCKLQ